RRSSWCGPVNWPYSMRRRCVNSKYFSLGTRRTSEEHWNSRLGIGQQNAIDSMCPSFAKHRARVLTERPEKSRVAASFRTEERRVLERLFKLVEKRTNVKRGMLGGLTTFITKAYLNVVNPPILSQAGDD